MSNEMLAQLSEIANLFVAEMKAKLIDINAPDNDRQSVKNSIYIDAPKTITEGRYSIDIRIPLSEAPVAAALEWGSGEHDRRGDYPDGYPIVAHTDAGMIFPREDWPNYEPPPDTQIFKFFEVMHPGIKPNPFIAPSIDKTKEEIKRRLTKTLIASKLLITGNTYSGRHYEVIMVGGSGSGK